MLTGSADDATLVLATPLDISTFGSSTLTFDWSIELGLDSAEYLALDVSRDRGGSWTKSVRRLDGNVGAESTWHNKTVDLTLYVSSDLLIRFHSKVSSSREVADIDNVKIIGSNASIMTAASGRECLYPANLYIAQQ